MKKQLISMLCGAAVLGMAVPTLAATELTGLFRVEGVYQSQPLTKDAPAKQWIAQRVRAKSITTVNDYVQFVYWAEIDTDWGVNNPNTTNNDGAMSADGMNVETKNIYAAIKLPITGVDIKVTAGIVNFADSIQNMFFNDDAAALIIAGKFDKVSADVGFSKLSEGAVTNAVVNANGTTTPARSLNTAITTDDDIDMYFVRGSAMVAEGAKVGAEIYYVANAGQGGTAAAGATSTITGADTYKSNLLMIDVNGSAKISMVNVDGFIAFEQNNQYTDRKSAAGGKVSGTALAGTINGSVKVDNFGGGLRVIYISGDTKKDAKKDNRWKEVSSALGFMFSDFPTMLADRYKVGGNGGFSDQLAIGRAEGGNGLLAVLLYGDATFGKFFVKAGAGMFNALDKKYKGVQNAKGTNYGTEISAQAGMKVADTATVSLRGSYAILGNFFDKTATDPKTGAATDPDDIKYAALILDVPF